MARFEKVLTPTYQVSFDSVAELYELLRFVNSNATWFSEERNPEMAHFCDQINEFFQTETKGSKKISFR
jgi:hypothetical protein